MAARRWAWRSTSWRGASREVGSAMKSNDPMTGSRLPDIDENARINELGARASWRAETLRGSGSGDGAIDDKNISRRRLEP